MTLDEIAKAIESNELTNPQIVFERTVEAIRRELCCCSGHQDFNGKDILCDSCEYFINQEKK